MFLCRTMKRITINWPIGNHDDFSAKYHAHADQYHHKIKVTVQRSLFDIVTEKSFDMHMYTKTNLYKFNMNPHIYPTLAGNIYVHIPNII